MPELPDLTVYVEALRRIGKRIVIELENDFFIVVHLMIAGRLEWLDRGAKIPRKLGLAAFDFDSGTLLLTEAGSKKRASIHFVRGQDALEQHDRGGAEPLGIDREAFAAILRSESHTLKRALTDPRSFSGIGNAYSDEILHAARLSPLQLTRKLTAEEVTRLFVATRETLQTWIDRLRDQARGRFPEKVTAFRPEMAVHGRYGIPVPFAARRYSGSSTPRTRRTTVRPVRPAASCCGIARSRGCCARTGPDRSTSDPRVASRHERA